MSLSNGRDALGDTGKWRVSVRIGWFEALWLCASPFIQAMQELDIDISQNTIVEGGVATLGTPQYRR